MDQTVSCLGERELLDVARNLSAGCKVHRRRVFEHEKLEQLAQHANIPAANALVRPLPPVPGVRRFLHARKRRQRAPEDRLCRRWQQRRHSLLAGGLTGVDIRVATPKGYEPNGGIVSWHAKPL